MFQFKNSVFFVLVLIFHNNLGLEYNRHRYTQNTDFLLHEGGINQNVPKRDNDEIQSNSGSTPALNTATTKLDFPPLRPPSTTQTTSHPQNNQHGSRTAQTSGKRDYVAPNYPPLQPPKSSQNGNGNLPSINNNPSQAAQNTQSSGKRDYVAPNYPPLKPPTNSQNGNANLPNMNQNHPQGQGTQPGGRRDYVAPNYPTLRPPSTPGGVHSQTQSQNNPLPTPAPGKRDYVNPNAPSHNSPNTQPGKVKDLINFYDNKNKQPSNPPKTPSYSSVAQGTSNNNQGSGVNLPSPLPASPTPKPFSFSDIVSGSTRHTTVPSTKPSPSGAGRNPTTARPSVVPSNKNQGTSGNAVTDTELQTLSEELLRKDTNNAAKYITINYQGKTTSQSKEDKAAGPLLTVSPEAWTIPTIQKFVVLLDNYERDTLVNEHVTPQERNEENAFMDAIMSTAVIRHLMSYLKDKGYVSPDPRQQRDFLKQLWFSLYSRGKGKISSSGFEHSFVSELKNGEVSGLHNWIYLSKEEQANRLNYLGYLKYEEFSGQKGAVIKLHFNHLGTDKPVDSIFVGTSPELEMSLYTLCFVTRADNECNLKLGGQDVNIKTYTFRYRSKNLIGSAFPQI